MTTTRRAVSSPLHNLHEGDFFVASDLPNWDTMEAVDLEKGLYDPYEFYIYHRNIPAVAQAMFCLAPMPGCCGVVVSTRSRKFNNIHSWQFHAIKEVVAKLLGYSAMICTVQTENFPEVVGAAKYGRWKFGHAFINKRTGNQLAIGVKKLS